MGFHVNMAPHAVLDHNTKATAMALTQFIEILCLYLSCSRHTLPVGANFSRARTYVGLPNWLGRPRTIDEANDSFLHSGD